MWAPSTESLSFEQALRTQSEVSISHALTLVRVSDSETEQQTVNMSPKFYDSRAEAVGADRGWKWRDHGLSIGSYAFGSDLTGREKRAARFSPDSGPRTNCCTCTSHFAIAAATPGLFTELMRPLGELSFSPWGMAHCPLLLCAHWF
jgi:hypothetical protein